MNGPEHYRAAERLAADAERHAQGDPLDQAYAAVTATRALVHATLALTAATAAGVGGELAAARDIATDPSSSEGAAWAEVIR